MCKKKYLSWVYDVDRKICHLGSLFGMPISDPRDRFFYPHHAPMKDTFSCILWAADWEKILWCIDTPSREITVDCNGLFLKESLRSEELIQLALRESRFIPVRCMGTHLCFPPVLQKETTFITSCVVLWATKSFRNGISSWRTEFAPPIQSDVFLVKFDKLDIKRHYHIFLFIMHY